MINGLLLPRVHEFTLADELKLWWVVQGELTHDLAMYYTICSIAGFVQGYALGLCVIGKL